ncbi:MAG: GAF domain-containing protein, partial [Chloroflexota bacterium]
MFTIRTSFRNRLLIIISLTAAYIAIYALLHPSIGAAVNVLVIVPAAMTAWLFGVRGGIVASICATGLTTLLLTLSHDPSLTDPNWQGTRLLGYGVIGFVTITFGVVHQLSERLNRELIKRQEAERIQNQRNAELEAVHRASLQLSSSLGLKPLLETILTQVSTLLHSQEARVFLFDGQNITFGGVIGQSNAESLPPREPRSTGLTYRVALSGKRIVISDVNQHPLYQEMKWGGAIGGFPLSIGARVYGVMNVSYSHPHDFSEGELRIIELLADQAAVAIRNAHDFEQSRHHAEELEQAVAERTAELLRAKESAEALINNSFDVILRLSADGLIKQTNPAFERVFGRERGESFANLFRNETLIDATLKSVVADHAIQQLEATALRDGGEFTADLVFVPLESAGAVVEILCNLRDVSERKRADMRQRALSHGLRKVLVLTYELISCSDIDDLWRRAVEMAREVLNVERCAIFIDRDSFMYGTYGTNLQGETTDEHDQTFFKG